MARSVLEKTNGWHTKTLTEDVEFSVMMAIEDEKIVWAEQAITYDEEPNDFMQSLKQRRRWVSGIVQTCIIKMPQLVRSLKSGKPWRRLDSMMLILGPFISVLALIPAAASFLNALISEQIIPYGLSLLLGGLISYVAAIALATFVVVHAKRWDKRMLKSVLTYPIFLASWLPLKILAICKRTTRWEAIEHTRAIAFNEVRMPEKEYDVAS